MTEIERIIEKGIISEDFLKEELIDGCEVNTDLKKIWAVLLDLLYEFDKICKKYDLKYWLAYGSLIGAVRHKGFIPWDDDLDVFMMRKDYERLISIASKEFEHPYFFQTPHTDPGYYFSFAKIRNSNTTGTSKVFAYENYNQGIFLDIFPLDVSIVEGAQERYNEIKELILQNSTNMRIHYPYPDETELLRRKKYCNGENQLEIAEKIQKIASQFDGQISEYVVAGTNTMSPLEKETFPKGAFSDTLYVDLYGIKAPIPYGYDDVLKSTYGNYMIMPDENDRVWHSNGIFSVDKDYKTLLKEIKEKDDK
ncbi:phosphorylcholine transferase LicD [uncultured Eubacterium sp.]|uniref:LicD family protein n=1 Tax=uncultured Eubacterium sp. TaxID=165185 RepID=UPI00258D3209|nr:LicD family protein [uncultured Eubacterium sp.]